MVRTMEIRDVIERIRIKITDENAYRFTDDNIVLIINDAVRLIRNVFIDEMPEMMCEPKVTGTLAGGENAVKGRLALWAYSLRFTHPTTGEKLRFEIEPPADERPWNNFKIDLK